MGLISVLLSHPEEIPALWKMMKAANEAKKFPKNKSLAFCYEILVKVSRSFAVVIQELHPELRDAVCIFYLVLRGLDTVEDDMAIPDDVKIPLLHCFHEKCYDRKFTMDVGDHNGHYKRLMAEYPLVVDSFLRLKPGYQEVIADITKRMGAGMAEFIPKEVNTVEEYDKYCYYVAGLVGVGLSKLFAVSELESEEFMDLAEGQLSDSMGKFLQKTNIIRDYLEDINEEPAPRMFWPKEVWGEYATTLEDFKDPENAEQAVACLNHLVTDALRHLPECFEYMTKLTSPSVLSFCAIPQVMAMATLAEVYNNHGVFTGVVKIRRGLSARIATECKTMASTVAWISRFAGELALKVQPSNDPNAQRTLEAIERVEDLCAETLLKLGVTRNDVGAKRQAGLAQMDAVDEPIALGVRIALWLLMFGFFCYAFGVGSVRASLGVDSSYQGHLPLQYFNQAIAVAGLGMASILAFHGKKW